jgi:hypothetical protein
MGEGDDYALNLGLEAFAVQFYLVALFLFLLDNAG